MRRLFFLAIVCLIVCGSPAMAKDPPTDRVEKYARQWTVFLDATIKVGDTEADVLKKLAHARRDHGRFHRGGNGVYKLCILIDDFHQVNVECDHEHKVIEKAVVRKKTKWLRTDASGAIIELDDNGALVLD